MGEGESRSCVMGVGEVGDLFRCLRGAGVGPFLALGERPPSLAGWSAESVLGTGGRGLFFLSISALWGCGLCDGEVFGLVGGTGRTLCFPPLPCGLASGVGGRGLLDRASSGWEVCFDEVSNPFLFSACM